MGGSAEITQGSKESIRTWWAEYPMTYGQTHGKTTYVGEGGQAEEVEIGSRRFFDLADQVFYSWNEHLHTEAGKFGRIFDYDRYREKNVLEIGCGMGCMASNWATQGANVTAADLNPTAIEQTKARFRAYDLSGTIREADAENLPFEDEAFDFVYSWGVLHHSPNPAKSLQEIFRVLKPDGRTGVMLYSRESFLARYTIEFAEGLVNYENKSLDPLQLFSRYGDGAREEGNPHTWPVTRDEIRTQLFSPFADIEIETFGTDVPEILKSLLPKLDRLPKSWIAALSRRWGWSYWITASKPR